MNEESIKIRPETHALARLVSSAVAQRKRRYRGTQSSALLFLEASCTEIPSALIEDTVLKPVDKVIWLVLMLCARKGGGQTVLPTLLELARKANVAAKVTVIKSLSMLRCGRWLTMCHTSRHRGGGQKSSAYILHSRPLPLQETIYLDPHYPANMEKLTGHWHARVRKVAHDTLEDMKRIAKTKSAPLEK